MGISESTGTVNRMLHFFQHPEVMAEAMCVASADVCSKMIKQGFRKETDPYGNHWAPRKKNYPWRILNKTGAMMSAWHTVVQMHGYTFRFIFDNDKSYAGYHQEGTKYMAQRRMVPTDGAKLDKSWQDAIDKATLNVMKQHVAAAGGK